MDNYPKIQLVLQILLSMKNTIKKLTTVITIIMTIKSYAQITDVKKDSLIKDTLEYTIEECDFLIKDTLEITQIEIRAAHSAYRMNKGTYTINGNVVDKKTFELMTKNVDSLANLVSCYSYNRKYFKIYDSNKYLLEEGRWHPEFFCGYYKKYYSNGQIEEEGTYTDFNDINYEPGQKTGTWIYYYKNGKIKMKNNFTPKYKKVILPSRN